MEQNFVVLKNRAVISISGEDRKVFLQGLITGDVNKVSENQAIYALMLSPQGRFLYDFFIVEDKDRLLVDCCLDRVEEIIKKLSFYKLRLKVEMKKEEELLVVSGKLLVGGGVSFVDPRNAELGYRAIIARGFCDAVIQNGDEQSELLCQGDVSSCSDDEYNFRRINLKIPDDSDLTFEKSFPLEFGFDDLNAIDYKKGCYVGQEITARTHYKGVIRKKVFLIEVLGVEEISKGVEIEIKEDGVMKKVGEVLSSVFYQGKLFALGLIKNLDNEGKETNFGKLKLSVEGKEIKLIK